MKHCPKCQSTNIAHGRTIPGRTTRYDICADCLSIWESLPPGEPYMRDGELMPFAEPCDNCAFRPGSPESRNKKAWRDLLVQLRKGGRFFCHKGVPMVRTADGGFGEFDFPKGPDGQWDQSCMRLCRGFLNAWATWELKKLKRQQHSGKESRHG